MFSGILSSATWGHRVAYTAGSKLSNTGQFFAAIDIDVFMEREVFYSRLDAVSGFVHFS